MLKFYFSYTTNLNFNIINILLIYGRQAAIEQLFNNNKLINKNLYFKVNIKHRLNYN